MEGTSIRIIKALAAEGLGTNMHGIFGLWSTVKEIEYNKCERQGSTDACAKWNAALGQVILGAAWITLPLSDQFSGMPASISGSVSSGSWNSTMSSIVGMAKIKLPDCLGMQATGSQLTTFLADSVESVQMGWGRIRLNTPPVQVVYEVDISVICHDRRLLEHSEVKRVQYIRQPICPVRYYSGLID